MEERFLSALRRDSWKESAGSSPAPASHHLTRPSAGSRGFLSFSLSLLLLLLTLGPAWGHSFAPALLDLREADTGRFDVVWKAAGLGAGAVGVERLQPELPPECKPLSPWTSGDDGIERVTSCRVDCGPRRLRGETLTVRGIETSRVDAIVRISWNDGDSATGVLRTGSPEFVVPTRAGAVQHVGAPARAVLSSYLGLGVEHILRGTDHLLFVLGLLLLVRGWRRLLETISAFTLAHSVTLALAILGFVHISPQPVEALIALSIVLLAAEVARPEGGAPTLARRWPWLMAMLFGFLHGLGFAGALAQIGLPPDQIPLALFAFNLGVEVGQLIFVAAMLLPLALLARAIVRWPWIRLLPAYGIGTVAMAWTLQRIQFFWFVGM